MGRRSWGGGPETTALKWFGRVDVSAVENEFAGPRGNRSGTGSFCVRELEYELPDSLIAQEPAAVRGQSRMLVVDRETGELTDARVKDLPQYLTPKDVLVLNNTRVLPAKFVLVRESGGRIEGLFLHDHSGGEWEVLLKGANRVAEGENLNFESECRTWSVQTVSRGERGRWRIRVKPMTFVAEVLDKVGRMPLPPYIKRDKGADVRDEGDRERYQTVFANKDGAVAAPTAGLHFTPQMLSDIKESGVGVEYVTLHVGYGTFAPLEVDDLADHDMHSEFYELDRQVGRRLMEVRQSGGRVVGVGTTSARVLETAWNLTRWEGDTNGWTDLFCYPPYEIKGVDTLLTNFHLPKSTLLALVMSFAGIDLIRKAYAHAIEEKYRFFSYGDAMLIL